MKRNFENLLNQSTSPSELPEGLVFMSRYARRNYGEGQTTVESMIHDNR